MEPDPEPEVVEDTKPKKLSPFDFLGSITFSKENLIVDAATEKQYIPFIVNRGLANSMDTIIYANEMNSRPHIDRQMQYEFLRRAIPKRKRYDKWAKAEDIEDFDLVKEHYGFNDQKTMEALRILTPEAIERIKVKMNKGGISK